MPTIASELTAKAVEALRHGTVRGEAKGAAKKTKLKPGDPCTAYHAVGGVPGLLLCCKPPTGDQKIGYRSWVLRTQVGGKRRDIGLGSYGGKHSVTLKEARERAFKIKHDIWHGAGPPVEDKRVKRAAQEFAEAKRKTFEQVAREYIEKKSKEYKSEKQSYKLNQQLRTYAYPHIGKMVVGDIERAHIVQLLEPIWHAKNQTASRVRLHVERVLDLAGVKGLRTGDNPARWAGNLALSFAPGHKVAKRQHHKALPVAEMYAFWRDLKALDSIGAKALAFQVLTAARPGEVRKATWDEIDLRRKLWKIPAERMKGGKAHTVPLTAEAVALVKSLPRLGMYLFPGPQGKPISDVSVSKVPKQLGHNVTAHGFRSTFKDWAREHTSYPDEVSELALAHVGTDATRAAYARSELIDKRRKLMDDWEHFILHGHGKSGGKVVPMRKRG